MWTLSTRPGLTLLSESVQARGRDGGDAFLAPIFGEGGKVGAGFPTVLANRLHNVVTVIWEFITLTHTFCLS